MIGDDFVIKPKTEVYFMKKEGSYPFGSDGFLSGAENYPFVRPWLTTTNKKSKLEKMGRSVMRSQETCWKGQDIQDLIGVSRGTVGCVLDLFC